MNVSEYDDWERDGRKYSTERGGGFFFDRQQGYKRTGEFKINKAEWWITPSNQTKEGAGRRRREEEEEEEGCLRFPKDNVYLFPALYFTFLSTSPSLSLSYILIYSPSPPLPCCSLVSLLPLSDFISQRHAWLCPAAYCDTLMPH